MAALALRAVAALRAPGVRGPDGRRGVRALRRTPVRVLPSAAENRAREGQEEEAEAAAAAPGRKPKRRPPSGPCALTPPVTPPVTPAPTTLESAGLRFHKALPGDSRLRKVITIVKSRSFRDREGKILLEGQRLIIDALTAGAVPKTLFFSRAEDVKKLPLDKLKGAELIKVKFEDIKTWSDLVTPQGLIGIFAKPDHTKVKYPAMQLHNTLPLLLICDSLRDPGNLGTILRSAAAAGCSRVLLTKGCVDAWEPKVLRAGMGAHFQVPILSNLEWETLPDYLPPETTVHVADNCGRFAQARLSERGQERRLKCDRRYLKFHRPEESGDEGGDPSEGWLPDVFLQTYDEEWTEAPATAVVVGGETRGVSLESLELAGSTGGRRLLIPVVPGVDSLNSAMAASILLFEGKRQLRAREGRGGGPRRVAEGYADPA
ncbi:rRNA methyltransferase 3, mitochondrial [Ornithorhynchus anatinus]|uniref:Mitochondrial rRNA methyltransferase 3 n=1 Tax=Ornithorhynchus anatinus TaxID=9258 RepID=F6SS11_ORNAN|nr:rRNA methyltransferase 3, mitochondrial [Ornithorhynchus anatinus]